jgi:hypothetical protein
MRERFTYEIANWLDGRWNVTLIREDTFSRDAASIARSLLEQWIVGHARELAGGTRVFVYAGRDAARRSAPKSLDRAQEATQPQTATPADRGETEHGRARPERTRHLAATVRVRVFDGSLTVRDADPVAVAYLADAKSDHQVSA